MGMNSSPLFQVDFSRIRESLLIVADDIDFITNASEDDLAGYEVWEARERAGRHLFRLGQLLNHGSLELADCSEDEIASLSNVWLYLKFLRFGDHCENASEYCGPLFLPGELDSHGQLRTADQRYPKYGRLTEGVDLQQVTDSLNEARRQLNPAAEPVEIDWLTSKRQDWEDYPAELRTVASWMNPPSERQFVATVSSPVTAGSGMSTATATDLPKVNLKTNQVRYCGECFDVKSEGALLISELVKNRPHPISASKFLAKPSRTKDELPKKLREIIDTAPGKGYWLTI